MDNLHDSGRPLAEGIFSLYHIHSCKMMKNKAHTAHSVM